VYVRLNFWTGASHPVRLTDTCDGKLPEADIAPQLGDGFTFSPESYSTHPAHRNKVKHLFYLGYSVEKWCSRYPRVTPEDRLNQVYILAKVCGQTT
jgi:hypothetical protein